MGANQRRRLDLGAVAAGFRAGRGRSSSGTWGTGPEGGGKRKASHWFAARPERRSIAIRPPAARIIDPEFGDFYGIGFDRDLGELVIRFKVSGISREALEVRQMRVQREVVREPSRVRISQFKSVRIETNRPDGRGEVGRGGRGHQDGPTSTREDDVARWKARTRISTDGGKTWE